MAVLKESIFYNWISPDPFLGADWTFQYSENLDFRTDLNGVQLLPAEQNRSTTDILMCYVKFDKTHLVRIYSSGRVTTGDNTAFTETNLCNIWFAPLGATKFRWEVYVFGMANIVRFDMTWVVTDVTPLAWRGPTPWVTTGGTPVINFWNSALLVWFGNKLRRWLPSTVDWPVPIGGWKMIRTFDKATIRGLVWRSSNIEVYTDYNGLDSRVYYIGWFWDAEDTGVSDTVVFENLSILQIWQLGNRVFVLFLDKTDDKTTYLYEVSGYNKRLIRRSRQDWWNTAYMDDFNVKVAYQPLSAYWDMLFCPFADWVWTHGRYNDYTPDALIKQWPGKSFYSATCFWPRLYCSYNAAGGYREVRYPLMNRYNDFTSETWVLISKIYQGNIRVNKHIERIWISYKFDITGLPALQTAGEIRFYVRSDRVWYNVTNWRILLATITDTTKMVHRIEPQEIMRANVPDCNVFEWKVEISRGTYNAVTPTFYDVEIEYGEVKD